MAISYQVESVLADSNTARQRTGMVASPVQVVMLVCQGGRGGRSRRRLEIFRNVAKSSETVELLLVGNASRRRKIRQAGMFVESHFRQRRSGCVVAAAACPSWPGAIASGLFAGVVAVISIVHGRLRAAARFHLCLLALDTWPPLLGWPPLLPAG